MNKDHNIENYLFISPNKFEIHLLDTKNFKNVYKDQFIINGNSEFYNLSDLKKFLDINIFKIERLSGKFVKNIFLIIEEKKDLNLEIGIKKKNYNTLVTKQYLENLLVEAKDLFRENYKDQEIMHMIINKYFFDGKSHLIFKENLKCDHIALEIQFKFISNSIIYDLNKILENYQIKISRYINSRYIKNIFNNDMELSEMAHRILKGYNENEVTFVQKKHKKISLFRKIFSTI
ncbi:hypothetical protein N9U50_01305 [Candidatus Pelagibacter sp.]|nr:hypothetical protein [Candidatus Pelagibacter sp.]